MTTFKTESGSTYEVDRVNKLIRKINGFTDVTNRQGSLGEFKPYLTIFLEKGKSCLVTYSQAVPRLDSTEEYAKNNPEMIIVPATVTSLVTDIYENN